MGQEFNAQVTFSVNPDEVLEALAKITEKVAATGDAADKTGEKLKGLGKKAEEGADLSTAHLLKMAVGFGTVAGAADKMFELVFEGIKHLIEIIPEAIEHTAKLVETYEALSVTAGMSVQDFNRWTGVMELAGGKAEDLTGIVHGMERGIRQHSASLVANGIFASEAALKQATLGEYINRVVETMESYGDATSRDQLLMEAFGRGGMEFAAQLVKIHERMQEGMELGEQDGILTRKAIEDTQELQKAKGELAHQEALSQSLIADATVKTDIAFQRWKASELKAQNESIMVNQMAEKGLISIHEKTLMVMGQDRQWREQTVQDFEAMRAEAAEYLKVQEELAKAGHDIGDGLATIARINREIAEQDARDAAKKAGKKLKAGDFGYQAPAFDPEAATKAAEAAKAKAEAAKADQAILNALQEQMNHLKLEELQAAEAITLQDKQLKADALAKARMEEEIRKADATLGTSSSSGNLEAATAAKAEAQKVYQLQVKANQDAFDREQKEAAEHLQAELNQIDEEGLDKRVDAIKARFVTMRKYAQAHNLNMLTDAQWAANQAADISRETSKVTEEDVGKIRKELEHLAKEKGAPLTVAESLKALETIAKGKTPQAVAQITTELQRLGSASAGVKSGIKTFVVESQDDFKNFGNFAAGAANSFSGSMGGAVADVLTKHKSGAEALKGVWSSFSRAVIQSLAEIETKKMIGYALDQTISDGTKALKTTDVAVTAQAAVAKQAIDASATASSVAAGTAQEAPFLAAMAAKIYAWYSSLGPWAIPAAAATVAAVVASIRKLEGRELGGDVSAGQPYIVGEAGHELFIPGVSGAIIPHDMTKAMQMGAALARANASTENTVGNYNDLGHSYAKAAIAGKAGPGGSGGDTINHVHLEGANIMGSSVESTRQIGNHMASGLRDYDRRNG